MKSINLNSTIILAAVFFLCFSLLDAQAQNGTIELQTTTNAPVRIPYHVEPLIVVNVIGFVAFVITNRRDLV